MSGGLLVSLLGVCCLATVTVYGSQPKFQFVEEWNLWKGDHDKAYGSQLEELERHLVWLSNKKYIEQHNANSHLFGFTLAMNHFGDMTDQEFYDQYFSSYNGNKSGNYTNVRVFRTEPWMTYPESVDWRTKGAVTSVKNQGQCAASYAFSAMGALEGAQALATGKLKALSEQNIIDCSVPYGNHGCHGGNMYYSYLYVLSNDGVDTQSSYSFKGKQSSCNYNKQNRGASISGTVSIRSGSESDLEAAVANVGPVAVAIDGASNAFRFYYRGVYDSSRCSSTSLNHAMVVTGYGTAGGKNYWLAKNSWGTNWGQSGFVMMARNKYNQCGIATDASYPTL